MAGTLPPSSTSLAPKKLISALATDIGVARHVRSLVAEACETLAISARTPRIEIADKLGFHYRQDSSIAPNLGIYIPDPPSITIDPIIWKDRAAFTFFHEVTHYLLDKDGRLISYLHDAVKDEFEFRQTIERACNTGAAEFLIPHSEVLRLASGVQWDSQLIRKVHRSFSASWVACVLQIASVAPHDCIGVVCGQNSNSQVQPSRLRANSVDSTGHLEVLHSISSNSMKYSVARGTRVPIEHAFWSVWETGLDVDVQSFIPYRSGKRQPCRCVGARQGPVILGLLHAIDPPDPRQLRLVP